MFTGLIQEVGEIVEINKIGGSIHLRVFAPRCAPDLSISDSVAVNGVCLTVTDRTTDNFIVQAVEETLRKTTLGETKPSGRVNIELAARLSDRLGGHLVQGHVDCVGRVTEVVKQFSSRLVTVEFPGEFARYLIPVGSIAIDGVSLTVASVEQSALTVSLIPHTLENTTFTNLRTEMRVNLEFDLVGKYIERLLHSGTPDQIERGISFEKLKSWGYDV